jgi:hypothetical protein
VTCHILPIEWGVPSDIWLIVDSSSVYHHALCVVSGVSSGRMRLVAFLFFSNDPPLISSQIDPRTLAGRCPGKTTR